MDHLIEDHMRRFPEIVQALSEPIGQPLLHIYSHVGDNADMMIHAPQPPGPGPAPVDDRRAVQAVMGLLAAEQEEIDAGCIFTQDDGIRTSGRIFHSQYIELLRMVINLNLLHSCVNNVNKALVDKRKFIILLRRLSTKLEQVTPKYPSTSRICTHHDPSHCSIKNHVHFPPYEFLRKLGEDLLANRLEWEDCQNRSDDMGLFVMDDADMYATNLELVVGMLRQ